jgi:hypothetical protein
VVSGGYQVYPRIELFYGVDALGQNAPLHQNLAALGDRLRPHFDGSDGILNVNFVVFTDGAYAIHGYNLPPNRQPFTQDFNFADFGKRRRLGEHRLHCAGGSIGTRIGGLGADEDRDRAARAGSDRVIAVGMTRAGNA